MKLVFTYTFRFICQRWKTFVAVMLVSVISLVLTENVLVNYRESRYELDETKSVPAMDCNMIYRVRLTSMDFMNPEITKGLKRTIMEIQDLPGVLCAGKYVCMDESSKEAGHVQCIHMEPELLQCVLHKGQNIKNLSSTEDVVYIGNSVNKRLLGKQLTLKSENKVYEIADVLPKGLKWFPTEGYTVSIGNPVCLDNYVIVNDYGDYLSDDDANDYNTQYSYMKVLYIIEEDADASDIKEKIYNIAERNGISLDIKNLNEMFEEYEEENKEQISETLGILLVMLGLCIIAISSSSAVAVLLRKRTFGIMYCSGVKYWQVSLICVLENAVRVAVSEIIAFALTGLMLAGRAASDYQASVYRAIHYGRNMIDMPIICILITAVASIVPLVILYNYDTVNLIRGKE